jgi:lysophospholipase L1-like esterase
MKALLVVLTSVLLAVVAGGGLYLAAVKHLHWAVVRPLLGSGLVRAYLTDPSFRQLLQVMDDERSERANSFAVFWGADNTELVSKRLFRPVEMYGVHRYMYRPDVKTLQFVAGASGVYRAMEMEDTPALRRALSGLDTKRLAEASYDRHGFRRVDADLSRDCTARVLFLGDSFTDGSGVNDAETFVNRYGHLVRDRLGLSICPINAGVEGYGSLEESYVLETYFDTFARPPLIVLMHYANDVADDVDAVLGGALAESDAKWQTSLDYLSRMEAFAHRAHATLVIAAIPPAGQFSTTWTRRNYQEVLRRFCARQRVPFVDLFDSLERFGSGRAYFDDDPHWTPAGHQVVAEALYEATWTMLPR